MPVQDTSLNAYRNEVKPTLGRKQLDVLEAFKHKEEFTDKELARFLNWEINTVTPRRGELAALNYLEIARKRKCKETGRMAIAWRLANQLAPIKPEPTKGMERVTRREWVFDSETNPGKKYQVMDFTAYYICNCPYFDKAHKTCKHILKVREMERRPSEARTEAKIKQPSLF